MAKEYIEREAALRIIKEYGKIAIDVGEPFLDPIDDIVAISKYIANIPDADVAPVVHGRWEMNSYRPDNIICTNCDVGFDVWKHEAKDFNYCPNCGARMDGDER